MPRRPPLQVGQLPRHDICRAYCMVAEVAALHPRLLVALRGALRERINLLKPSQLAATMAGLAELGNQDGLLCDPVAQCAFEAGGRGC